MLNSEDVLSTIKCLKKLGTKINLKKNYCEVIGLGLNSFALKKNLTLNAGNSGTLGRLILGLLIHYPHKIKLIGDKSLSKRDFLRVINPLKNFGANFYQSGKSSLPLYIQGTKYVRPIRYYENRGSAQCKSSVILAAIKTNGKTIIKAKKSRNHTELLCKYLKLPIRVKEKKKYDLIEINKLMKIKTLNYKIPVI